MAANASDYTDFAHTCPGTLAGRYLRRFWHPVHMARDLAPGRARPLRIMSEDFTLYRGDAWKLVGAQVSLYAIPPAFGANTEFRATRPGATVLARGSDNFRTSYLHAANVPSPQNRWAGNTFSGYNNPRVDALLDQLVVTVPPPERVAIERDLVREVMGDAPMWPLYWDTTNVLALRSVKGIRTGGGDYHTWNFIEWDKEP